MSKQTYFYAVGRRKSSSAAVKLFLKGTGKHTLLVNDKEVDLKAYFGGNQGLFENTTSPFNVLGSNYFTQFDSQVLLEGGGIRGQSDALRLGYARALIEYNDELKPTLKPYGLLKRDSRIKERKKPGLKKARKSPKWSKR